MGTCPTKNRISTPGIQFFPSLEQWFVGGNSPLWDGLLLISRWCPVQKRHSKSPINKRRSTSECPIKSPWTSPPLIRSKILTNPMVKPLGFSQFFPIRSRAASPAGPRSAPLRARRGRRVLGDSQGRFWSPRWGQKKIRPYGTTDFSICLVSTIQFLG